MIAMIAPLSPLPLPAKGQIPSTSIKHMEGSPLKVEQPVATTKTIVELDVYDFVCSRFETRRAVTRTSFLKGWYTAYHCAVHNSVEGSITAPKFL